MNSLMSCALALTQASAIAMPEVTNASFMGRLLNGLDYSEDACWINTLLTVTLGASLFSAHRPTAHFCSGGRRLKLAQIGRADEPWAAATVYGFMVLGS